jgi:hypothetical protein
MMDMEIGDGQRRSPVATGVAMQKHGVTLLGERV